MGYYTTFYCEVQDKDRVYIDDTSDKMKEIAWEFEKITEWFGFESREEFFEKYGERLEKWGFNSVFFDDVYKWYDYESDIIELSKKFPDYLFTIEGHGEDYDDVWRHYFLNGESQYTQVTMEFDECYLG